jgi:hypothetical protein
MQEHLDVVATQGAYLVPPPRTPVWQKAHDDEFVSELTMRLYSVIQIIQGIRRRQYFEAADEWPINHTPPEVKAEYEARLAAYDEKWNRTPGGTTSEESDDDDNDTNARVGTKKAVPALGMSPTSLKPQKLRAAGQPVTPPLSADDSPNASYQNRPRRTSKDHDEANERPAKEHVDAEEHKEGTERPAKDYVNSAKEVSAEKVSPAKKGCRVDAQQIDRKRQQDLQGDEEAISQKKRCRMTVKDNVQRPFE